jgi:uncharacterized membrane protein
MVACGSICNAAWWLKEPGSPWIAIRISDANAPKYSVARLYRQEKHTMLWTIFLVLLVLWLVGFIGFHVVGAYIHILLIIALVVLVIQLIGGRRAV